MKKDPLVTVYITNHNYERYIRQAYESVLNQTMTDFEVIVIDDGSTDGSRKIIEDFSGNEKTTIIFQKNQGLNITNNIALRAAKGKYIMRLDADDFLDANALLVLSNKLENDDDLGLVFPDYYLVDIEGSILGIEKRHEFSSEVKLLDQPAHGACTMIRRKFLLQLDGYDEDYSCQDGYELWIKFINTYKVDNVNTPLFYYRQHGQNLTSNENRILETRAKIKENYIKKKKEAPLETVAILPLRGSKTSRKNLTFEKLNGKPLIDWKIENICNARNISNLVVTSPDMEIQEYINDKYASYDNVSFLLRDISLARLNADLLETVQLVLNADDIRKSDPDAILISAIEFPFINASSFDDAINTMQIFDSDSLISVRPDNSMFFQHHGQGMSPILNQEKFSKLEREALYKYVGGISLTKVAFLNSHHKLIGGKVGHIVIDQKSSHGINTQFDLEVARFLSSQLNLNS